MTSYTMSNRVKPKSLLIHAVMIVCCILFIFPFLWMALTSFKTPQEIFQWPPRMFPKEWSFSNYQEVLTAVPLLRMLLNSLFVAVAVTAGTLLFSSLAAYSFARLRFKGKDLLFSMYLGTMMVPLMVTLIPTFVIMRKLGMVDTYYALIVPGFFGNAFGTFLLRQFFMTIPRQLDEAARIDGCGYFGIYSRILMPLMKPALASLFIFTFMGVWNDFLWPLVVIQTESVKTITLGLASFQGLYTTKYHLLMAAAMISVLPVLVAYISSQRYFIEGITLTGLKG
ncbi:carbohydrate ABC transporter permease [Cohnella phaseoli]|uniref:Carbohydrate ABC transporter membrane protein 2 (CUT1 family) n=1 Tax=Cohnella phaseoli TaxID=456490 RepID=A0A3D9IJN1_9BACL|nr:carbohydrate ABC transporter permease [Cohnella phaseoli]RED61911.1 carbohydrate ABC transporter membrane protein 2 (CUT1 family) [Cohnella phaseoli]